MPPGVRRLALQRFAMIFDLALVSFNFLVVMAVTTGEAHWPNVAHVFAMRIAVGNFVAFGLYLVVSALILPVVVFIAPTDCLM
jgi:hypothetical protein